MNKYQEAIKAIKNNYPNTGYAMLRKALDLAIKSLDKSTPMKPKVIDEDKQTFDCPRCGTTIYADNVKDFKYCLDCGQRLDWSDTDDN